ncbi:MAG: hypothetical protein ACRDGN_03210 [bacterium]
MSKLFRVVIAVIAAVMLVGLTPMSTTPGQVNVEVADPSAPEGG